jgi:hypothetical protein
VLFLIPVLTGTNTSPEVMLILHLEQRNKISFSVLIQDYPLISYHTEKELNKTDYSPLIYVQKTIIYSYQ